MLERKKMLEGDLNSPFKFINSWLLNHFERFQIDRDRERLVKREICNHVVFKIVRVFIGKFLTEHMFENSPCRPCGSGTAITPTKASGANFVPTTHLPAVDEYDTVVPINFSGKRECSVHS